MTDLGRLPSPADEDEPYPHPDCPACGGQWTKLGGDAWPVLYFRCRSCGHNWEVRVA
jgi:tRNA(Ile2) C34 agmatinyltransferase TiaS